MHVHDLIRDRLLTRAGLGTPPERCPWSLDQLYATQWSTEFERLMRNRLVMGALRYGPLNAPGKPKYDSLASMLRRLESYARSGNLEILVDVANLCLVEFVERRHPHAHWAADDTGLHHIRIN